MIFRVWPQRHEPVSHPKGALRQGRRPGTIPLWVLPDCGIHRRHVHGAGSPHPGGARRSDWRGQSLACLFPLQRFQGLPDRGRRPEYRRGRPVIQSASPRLARALFLVREWKRDHWPDSSRSRHCGRASSQPPHPGPGQASLGRCGLAPTQRLTVIRPPYRHALEAEGATDVSLVPESG